MPYAKNATRKIKTRHQPNVPVAISNRKQLSQEIF
jgi:hypothetical protein